jgi:hypothetical protein
MAAPALQDAVGMTIWSRAVQKAQQLALIYACSENHLEPEVTVDAIGWAWRFVSHLTRRMLYMVDTHLAESDFERNCKRFLEKLRGAPEKKLGHSVLLKRMKMSAKDFHALSETLRQRGEIETLQGDPSRHGPAPVTYRLVV